MQPQGRRRARALALPSVACLLSLLLHLEAPQVPHQSGDEVIYQILSQKMAWDLSHYSTGDHPWASRLPWPLYRSPLFVHPPLLPLVLKLGNSLGHPVGVGLLFLAGSLCLLLCFVWRALRALEVPETAIAGALALCALCPVLLHTTTRLVPDGLMAIYLFCGLSLAIDAFRSESKWSMFAAGSLLSVGLNAKFTGVVALPLLLLLQALYLRGEDAGAAWRVRLGAVRNWRLFAVLMLPLLLVGLQHHQRFVLEYGTLSPLALLQPDEGATPGKFSRRLYARTHLHMLGYLLATFPALLVVLHRGCYRALAALWREQPWATFYPLGFAYLFAILLAFQHREMRYLAPALPFLYVSLAILWKWGDRGLRRVIGLLVVLSLLTMATTSFDTAIRDPERAWIVPSLIDHVPVFRRHYL